MGIFKGSKKEIWLHCTADIPTDKIKDQTDHFKVKIKKMNPDEYDHMLEQIKSKRTTMDQQIRNRMVDWKIKGEDGEQIEFNDKNLEEFWLQQPYIYALSEAFIQLHIGKDAFKRIREKN